MTRFSRRKVLAIGGAGIAGLSTLSMKDWTALAYTSTDRVRYDAHSSDGQEMLKIYAEGVAAMKARAPSDPMSWTFQQYTHWVPMSDKTKEIERIFNASTKAERMMAEAMWETCRAHSGTSPDGEEVNWRAEIDWFTPWHRMYVHFFETIVGLAANKPEFTLPFWNYTEANKSSIPEEFLQPDDPLYGSLWRKDRWPGINEGKSVDPGDLSCLNAAHFKKVGNVQGFNRTLDAVPHGQVHDHVGDDDNMASIPTAAQDPIFWLHHSNVDRIWASWNAAGRENPKDEEWLSKKFQFTDGKALVTAETRDYDDTAKLGYSYATLLSPPGTAPLPLLLAQANAAGTEDAATLKAAAPEGAVRNISLQQKGVSVQPPLPAEASALKSTPGVNAGPRLYLIIEDLQTDSAPGTAYDVLLGLPGAHESNAPQIKVGQINFFNARLSGTSTPEDGGHSYSFDVTDQVATLRAQGETGATPEVTLAPSRDPQGVAQPVVGSVFFSLE